MLPVIDMHCDTIAGLYDRMRAGEKVSLRQNNMHVDLLRMKQSGYMCQSFALFTDLQEIRKAGISPFEHAKALLDYLDSELAANADLIRPALSGTDIRKNHEAGFMSALRTIEEGGVFEGDPANVEYFRKRGVRKATLTWNYENELAFPNRLTGGMERSSYAVARGMVPETEKGLKETGRAVVLQMESLGILIDVSHLSDAGILEVLQLVKKDTPVIASHSNARAVTGHPRNLTDGMLRQIAEHGGVTGINFCPDFLTDDGRQESRIADMIRHIRHIRKVAGTDVIGLGTDFDGIRGSLEADGAGGVPILAGALEKADFSSEEIEKIFYKNVLRVYTQVLG